MYLADHGSADHGSTDHVDSKFQDCTTQMLIFAVVFISKCVFRILLLAAQLQIIYFPRNFAVDMRLLRKYN